MDDKIAFYYSVLNVKLLHLLFSWALVVGSVAVKETTADNSARSTD